MMINNKENIRKGNTFSRSNLYFFREQRTAHLTTVEEVNNLEGSAQDIRR